MEYPPRAVRPTRRRPAARPRFQAPQFQPYQVRSVRPVSLPTSLPPPRGSMRSYEPNQPTHPPPPGDVPQQGTCTPPSTFNVVDCTSPRLIPPSDFFSSPLLASPRRPVSASPPTQHPLQQSPGTQPRVSLRDPTDNSRDNLTEAVTDSSSPPSGRLSSRSSFIWQHGSRQTINGAVYWICSECSHRLRFSGSTTNAKNHLRTHGIEETAPPADLSSVSESATEDLCIFFATAHLPLVKVQQPRFQSFCAALGYKPPCRTAIRNTHLPRIAQQIRSTIASIQFPLFLTTDLWTGRSREKFIGVTAHYTTPDWELHNMVLGVKRCEGESANGVISARIISIALSEVLNETSVALDQILAVTTDNGADVLCAARLAAIPVYRCAAHSLQLALRAFFETPLIDGLLRNATDLVSGLRVRFKDMELLRKAYEAAYPDFPYQELQKPCKTRWGDTYRMINSLLNHWWVLWSSFRADCLSSNLTEQDLPAFELLAKLLKPFAELHDMMQTRSRPVVGETLARLWVLATTTLPQPTAPISDAFRTRAVPVIKDYVRSQLLSDTIAGICFLDPRFKSFSWWSESNPLPRARAWLTAELPPPEPESLASCPPFDWTASVSYENASCPTQARGRSELELYASLPVVSCNDVHDFLNFSPLDWWKKEKRFPRLAQVARTWLALQVTSAAVESEFSSCGYTMTDRRTRMKGDTLSLLEFVGRNEHLLQVASSPDPKALS